MSELLPVRANPAALLPVDDVWRMAQAIAQSGLFGMKRPEEAMALMLIAQAEGLHPAVAARDYHIIEGKPALKADAMLARFIGAGGKVKWSSYSDEKVEATFSHAQGGEVTLAWTWAQASKIKVGRGDKVLTDKDTWKNFPRQMLRARVISEGIRTVFPGVAVGVYTPEEVQDLDEPAVVELRTVGAASPARQEPAREGSPFERPATTVAEVVQPPEGDDVQDWEAWRKVIVGHIQRATTADQVTAIQRANAAGLASCAAILDDTVSRMAALVEAKTAQLAAKQAEAA